MLIPYHHHHYPHRPTARLVCFNFSVTLVLRWVSLSWLIKDYQDFTVRCLIKKKYRESQDGGIGRHTAPPRTTRTDRKSNSKEVRYQVDKKETSIQTSRRGGDGHQGGDSHGYGGTETGSVWEERGRQSDH